jgi:hypothetical protein
VLADATTAFVILGVGALIGLILLLTGVGDGEGLTGAVIFGALVAAASVVAFLAR